MSGPAHEGKWLTVGGTIKGSSGYLHGVYGPGGGTAGLTLKIRDGGASGTILYELDTNVFGPAFPITFTLPVPIFFKTSIFVSLPGIPFGVVYE